MIEELLQEEEIKNVPYLRMFVGGDLVKSRKCKCKIEKRGRESIKRLEVRDCDFIQCKMENYFQPAYELRKCSCYSGQQTWTCSYSATKLPEILVIRIHDTEGNNDRVDVLEEIILEETSPGILFFASLQDSLGPEKESKFVHYHFI
mgnify:CR=1 FL=1